MIERIKILCVALCMLGQSGARADDSNLTIEPHKFTSQSGTEVDAERGELEVPLFHDDPTRGSLTVSFVRFKSTSENPGAPLVYLAGGPGGLGTGAATGRRFPLFMALREIGDVIALDQRGTGQTNTIPRCTYPGKISTDQPIDRAAIMEYYQEMAEHCSAYWIDEGVKIDAYNTWESAGDLEALRKALGATKLNLWSISYGTHLALAALKRNPESYERVVLMSSEGLAQTVKYPARTDAYFARLSASVAQDPEAAARIPDLLGALRDIVTQLKEHPVAVTIDPGEGGEPFEMKLGAYPIQLLMSGAISDPGGAAQLLQLVGAMQAGQFEPVANILYQRFLKEAIDGNSSMRGMSLMMDGASGISPDRLEQVRRQAGTSILADALNFPFPELFGHIKVTDLGDNFRAPFRTDVPALMFTGTLDGRTYPEAHDEVARNFSSLHRVTVENGGHNLFMIDPRVTEIILDFFRGDELMTDRLVVAPPDWVK